MAMELIETIEVGSGGAASIEFTSIPQDGVDLLLDFSLRKDGTFEASYAQFNSDTGSNYDFIRLYGNGSSAASTSGAAQTFVLIGSNSISTDTSNTFGNGQLYISNYTSTADKSVSSDSVSENNGTTAYQYLVAGKYSTSSAITSVKIVPVANSFVQYSTASLYKIY